MSVDAAAAHELTHYHRWKDMIELTDDDLEYLDEAMTSLQAIARYERALTEQDKKQLAADAYQRLQLYVRSLQQNE